MGGMPGMLLPGQTADPLYGYFYAVAGAVSALIIYSIIIITKVTGANIIWLLFSAVVSKLLHHIVIRCVPERLRCYKIISL